MNILLIEDETDILISNKEYLELNGYIVFTAESVTDARLHLAEMIPELIVLDIMLLDGSGIDFCREIRHYLSTPILFLSCKNEKQDIIQGLKAGGDDYLTKPYDMDELGARCEALLRRVSNVKKELPTKIETGSLTLDWLQRKAYLGSDDTVLTPKEFALLMFFVQNADKPFTAEEIYDIVWGMSPGGIGTVRVHISNLRKKLKINKSASFSLTMDNRKYYIWHNNTPVQPLD